MTGMHLKPEMRIIGIDDSPLLSKDVLVVGAVLRGGGWLDGLLSTHIEKDGTDATERLASMITQSRNYGQLRVVMLNGVTFGGFNVVDILELHRRTQLPVIVITRRFPDMDSIRRALENLPQPELRYESILKAGEINEVRDKMAWRPGLLPVQRHGKRRCGPTDRGHSRAQPAA